MTKVSDVTQCKNVIIGAGAGSEVKSAGCFGGEAGLIHSLVVATAISNLTVSARGPDALFPSPQTSGRDRERSDWRRADVAFKVYVSFCLQVPVLLEFLPCLP